LADNKVNFNKRPLPWQLTDVVREGDTNRYEGGVGGVADAVNQMLKQGIMSTPTGCPLYLTPENTGGTYAPAFASMNSPHDDTTANKYYANTDSVIPFNCNITQLSIKGRNTGTASVAIFRKDRYTGLYDRVQNLSVNLINGQAAISVNWQCLNEDIIAISETNGYLMVNDNQGSGNSFTFEWSDTAQTPILQRDDYKVGLGYTYAYVQDSVTLVPGTKLSASNGFSATPPGNPEAVTMTISSPQIQYIPNVDGDYIFIYSFLHNFEIKLTSLVEFVHSQPTAATEGKIIFNTSMQKWFYGNGASWDACPAVILGWATVAGGDIIESELLTVTTVNDKLDRSLLGISDIGKRRMGEFVSPALYPAVTTVNQADRFLLAQNGLPGINNLKGINIASFVNAVAGQMGFAIQTVSGTTPVINSADITGPTLITSTGVVNSISFTGGGWGDKNYPIHIVFNNVPTTFLVTTAGTDINYKDDNPNTADGNHAEISLLCGDLIWIGYSSTVGGGGVIDDEPEDEPLTQFLSPLANPDWCTTITLSVLAAGWVFEWMGIADGQYSVPSAIDIDWGDGTYLSCLGNDRFHTYLSAGEYIVKIYHKSFLEDIAGLSIRPSSNDYLIHSIVDTYTGDFAGGAATPLVGIWDVANRPVIGSYTSYLPNFVEARVLGTSVPCRSLEMTVPSVVIAAAGSYGRGFRNDYMEEFRLHGASLASAPYDTAVRIKDGGNIYLDTPNLSLSGGYRFNNPTRTISLHLGMSSVPPVNSSITTQYESPGIARVYVPQTLLAQYIAQWGNVPFEILPATIETTPGTWLAWGPGLTPL
jgi:hypothetical protein